jgi:hypothetical protein
VLAGHDLGNVVGQRQSDGLFYGYNFEHGDSIPDNSRYRSLSFSIALF